jgi:hypothetical protein
MDRELLDIINKMRGQMFEIESRIDFLYKKLNIEYIPQDSGVDPRLIAAIKKGNMLDAIKVYREIHNCDMNEAKAGIQELWGKYS